MVSVIIPTYNRYDLLLNAIKSVKEQTFKKFEIIVVNDCSTDARYNKTDWTKMGVRYFCTDKNYFNPLKARNIGLSKAKNKTIAFLDDDDMWLPDKLEKQFHFMEKWNYLLTYTEAFYSDSDSIYNPQKMYKKYLAEQYHKFIYNKLNLIKIPPVITRDIIQKHNLIITSSVMIHRDLINQVGIFEREPTMIKWEDWAYWLRCLKYTNCYFIDIPLVFYNNTPRAKYISRTK